MEMSKLVTRFCMPALVLLVLSGCGSSKSKSTSSTTESTPPTSVNSTIASQVPSRYKTKGSLIVASEAQYAPNEFIAPDGHTIIGMDIDLVRALATTMGLKAEFMNANFEAIIPGLAAGRYDLGASSFTDTKEREKTVDFVTYFTAGISFYAKASANLGVKTITDLCGKTVAVQKGTVEEEGAKEQSSTCTKEGKKAVTVLSFTGQNPVNLAILSGRAEVGMADSPVVAYQIKQNGEQLKLVGESYNFKPYGLALPKNSGLAEPVLAALKQLMANGTYTRILTKWAIQSGAINNPKINGAIS
jgi:polar amino acid transport system substrate-binding protein